MRLIPRYHEKTKLFLERCCLPHLAEAQAAPPAPPLSALRNQSFTTDFFTLCWLTSWSTAAAGLPRGGAGRKMTVTPAVSEESVKLKSLVRCRVGEIRRRASGSRGARQAGGVVPRLSGSP